MHDGLPKMKDLPAEMGGSGAADFRVSGRIAVVRPTCRGSPGTGRCDALTSPPSRVVAIFADANVAHDSSARASRHALADHSGADGRSRARDRRLQRRRDSGSLPCAMPRYSMRCGSELAAIQHRPRAVPREFLLPRGPRRRMRRASAIVARCVGAAVVPASTGSIRESVPASPGTPAVQRTEAADGRAGIRRRSSLFISAFRRLSLGRTRQGVGSTCSRPLRWSRRAGWKRAASTRSSRRASRRAVIAACFCPTT